MHGEHLIIQLLWEDDWELLALSTRRMSYLSRKWACGASPRIILLYLSLTWIKINERQEEPKITNTNSGKLLCRPSSSYKLLDRIVYIAWRVGHKIVAYNATSVRMGRRNSFFVFMCGYKLYNCYYQYYQYIYIYIYIYVIYIYIYIYICLCTVKSKKTIIRYLKL